MDDQTQAEEAGVRASQGDDQASAEARTLETVTPRAAIIFRANEARRAVKRLAGDVLLAKSILATDIGQHKKNSAEGPVDGNALPHDEGECFANLTLAYRCLEDASMRLGKAIQAADGGVSVHDRETTVGA